MSEDKQYKVSDDYHIANGYKDGGDGVSLEHENRGNNGGEGLFYNIHKGQISILVIAQFIVGLCVMYASYTITQSRVSDLTSDMARQKDVNILILEKLGRIEVDILWLKESQWRDRPAGRQKDGSK